MSLEEQLNALGPRSRESPASRLRQALELYDDGVALQMLNFRRRYPHLDEAALHAKMRAWLMRDNDAD